MRAFIIIAAVVIASAIDKSGEMEEDTAKFLVIALIIGLAMDIIELIRM